MAGYLCYLMCASSPMNNAASKMWAAECPRVGWPAGNLRGIFMGIRQKLADICLRAARLLDKGIRPTGGEISFQNSRYKYPCGNGRCREKREREMTSISVVFKDGNVDFVSSHAKAMNMAIEEVVSQDIMLAEALRKEIVKGRKIVISDRDGNAIKEVAFPIPMGVA